MAQFASLNYDASVWEVMVALTAGATLCLLPPDVPAAGAELSRWLRDSEITTILLPPSVLATLPDEPLPRLRLLISGGEKCPRWLARQWSAGRRFVNAYGPTEVTVIVRHACGGPGERTGARDRLRLAEPGDRARHPL